MLLAHAYKLLLSSLCTVLSQVKAFLPRLEEADRQLQERLQGAETTDELDIENVDGSEACIQMVSGYT